MSKIVAILLAGFVSGALDLLSAFASYVSQGATVEGILKYIASGIVGPTAPQGGIAMACFGLFMHFALTTAMAAIFMIAAMKINFLTTRTWVAAVIYGVITWAAMVYFVVPFSAVAGWNLPHGWSIVSGLLAHVFYIGVPIAHITEFALRDPKRLA